MKKAAAVVILVGLLAFVGWRIYRKAATAKPPQGPRGRGAAAVAVEVAPVRRGAIRDVARYTGSLAAKSYFIVAPKIAGRLERLMVDIGDRVHRDQVIAVLDDEEYKQQVEQARAELQVAQADLEEAQSALEIEKRQYERVQALLAKKVASEAEFDAAKASYQAREAKCKVAMAQAAQKAAALKAAEVRLSYTRITASWEDDPGTGETRVVGERFADAGTMLRANDPIVSILAIDSLTAVLHVIERDYSRIRIGQEGILATDALPGKKFSGKIVRVAPLLKEASRQARVEIEVPNADGLLKPGMFVRVEIELARRADTTLVPISALARRNGQQGVFVADLEQMKARFVPVTIGIVSEQTAEILSPELNGMVVTLGHHLLEDGATIILPKTNFAGSAAEASPRENARMRTGAPR